MQTPNIKVCGMKYAENIAQIANIAGIGYIGFIFTPASPRFVGDDFQMPLLPAHIQKVGVFLNQSLDEVFRICAKYQLDAIQLHGNESPEYCNYAQSPIFQGRRGLEKRPKIIKAFGIDASFDWEILEDYVMDCDYFLLDTKGKHAGGNGMVFDWEILKDKNLKKSVFLSGGISLENITDVKEFLAQNPQIPIVTIDINSKFETDIAIKNEEKVRDFVDNMF